MLCTLELYKNMSETKDVEKTLTDKLTISGITRETVDLLTPTIDVKGINPNVYNYCYVKEMKRYYYIENTTIFPNGVCRLSMKVDVLMTYREDIKASTGLITKQASYNPYYGDYDVDSRISTRKLVFEDNFNRKGEFVLVALRGSEVTNG